MQIVWSLEIYHPCSCTYFNIPDSSGKFFVDELIIKHDTTESFDDENDKLRDCSNIRLFIKFDVALQDFVLHSKCMHSIENYTHIS